MIRGLNKITASPGLGYLMSSYTSHPGGFEEAQKDALVITAQLTLAGLVVFAPIAYGPGLEEVMKKLADIEDGDTYLQSHEFWMPICERFYQRADYAILAMTPGWNRSKGIAIELYALSRSATPVHVLDVEENHLWNLGEATEKWEDEFDGLFDISASLGVPHYLSEYTEQQSEAAKITIANRHAKQIVEEMKRGKR